MNWTQPLGKIDTHYTFDTIVQIRNVESINVPSCDDCGLNFFPLIHEVTDQRFFIIKALNDCIIGFTVLKFTFLIQDKRGVLGCGTIIQSDSSQFLITFINDRKSTFGTHLNIEKHHTMSLGRFVTIFVSINQHTCFRRNVTFKD